VNKNFHAARRTFFDLRNQFVSARNQFVAARSHFCGPEMKSSLNFGVWERFSGDAPG